MLGDDGRRIGDCHLLQNVGRTFGKSKRTAAVGQQFSMVVLPLLPSLFHPIPMVESGTWLEII